MIYNIKDIVLYGYHGLNKNEQNNGQYFIINISYEVKNNDISLIEKKCDNIDNYIDYMEIITMIEKSFYSKRYNLLESLAANIYKSLRLFNIINIKLSISKKHPGNRNNINEVSVTL